jgi:hypothetical protein
MNYLTEPALPNAFGFDVRKTVLDEFWASCRPHPVMSERGWDTVKRLRSVPYGIYLAFEQGGNCPPMVLAWREQPDKDLANPDDVGYELHGVSQPGHRDGPVPELVARFHDPIDAFIVDLARRVDDGAAEVLRRAGTLRVQSGELTAAYQVLVNAASLEVVDFIAERIEQHMVLRPVAFEDAVQEGLGEDLAPGLADAWALRGGPR